MRRISRANESVASSWVARYASDDKNPDKDVEELRADAARVNEGMEDVHERAQKLVKTIPGEQHEEVAEAMRRIRDQKR